jgi:hypothetical protein
MELTNLVLRAEYILSEKVTTKDATFSKLRDVIGARTVEYVYLDDNTAFMVDEDGIGKGRTLNLAATELVGSPILGDVMLVNFKEIDDIPYE